MASPAVRGGLVPSECGGRAELSGWTARTGPEVPWLAMSGTETEAFHDAIPSVDLSAVYEDEESDGEVASRPACTARRSSQPRAACRASATVVPVDRCLACGGSRAASQERTKPGGWAVNLNSRMLKRSGGLVCSMQLG